MDMVAGMIVNTVVFNGRPITEDEIRQAIRDVENALAVLKFKLDRWSPPTPVDLRANGAAVGAWLDSIGGSF